MEFKRFTSDDFKSWERFYRANFFNSIGGYKSLNLIGTKNADGVENLATFFSVIHLGANPPLLGMLFRPHTVARHSLENVYEQKYLTVNAVSEQIYKQAHQCSANYAAEESEFVATGLTAWYSKNFSAPYVQESSLKMGCRFVEEHLIEANKTIFMAAQIEEVFVQEEALLDDGFIEHQRMNGVSVNGLDAYYAPKQLDRLAYARPHEPIKSLQNGK